MTGNKYSRIDYGRRAVGVGRRALDDNGKYSDVQPGTKRGILPRVTILAALVAVLIGLGTGTAVALFSVNAVTKAGTITSGDLWISVGEMGWEQVTPGVAKTITPEDETNSGALSQTPIDFTSMPGDVIEIRVPVTTYLKGDNLEGEMTIDCSGTASSAYPTSATFHIENASGKQVEPQTDPGQTPVDSPIDTPLTVRGLLGGDAGTTAQWTVVIRVEVLGDYQWVGADPASQDGTISWSAGKVHATLNQVRTGGGAG